MREHFIGHYTPTEAEFKALWKDCFFSFDANVLLNLYWWQSTTRDRFFAILDNISDRIWLSNQAAKEYFQRRRSVIQDQADAYSSFVRTLDKSRKDLAALFSKHSSSDEVKGIMAQLDKAYLNAQEDIEVVEKIQPNFLEDDVILTRLTKLFNGKVGDAYSNEELSKLKKVFDERIDNRIPPGFKDKDKKGPERRYADILIWYQILDKAKELGKSVILITDDLKEDWWQMHNNDTVGPRPELIAEARDVAGVRFHMYSSELFISYAAKHLGTGEDKEAIADIVQTRERVLEEQRRYSALADRLERESEEFGALHDRRDKLLSRIARMNRVVERAGDVPDSLLDELIDADKQLTILNHELAVLGDAVEALQSELTRTSTLSARLDAVLTRSDSAAARVKVQEAKKRRAHRQSQPPKHEKS